MRVADLETRQPVTTVVGVLRGDHPECVGQLPRGAMAVVEQIVRAGETVFREGGLWKNIVADGVGFLKHPTAIPLFNYLSIPRRVLEINQILWICDILLIALPTEDNRTHGKCGERDGREKER